MANSNAIAMISVIFHIHLYRNCRRAVIVARVLAHINLYIPQSHVEVNLTLVSMGDDITCSRSIASMINSTVHVHVHRMSSTRHTTLDLYNVSIMSASLWKAIEKWINDHMYMYMYIYVHACTCTCAYRHAHMPQTTWDWEYVATAYMYMY